MQFSKKNPDFEITCLDGVAKTHLLLVQNITDYFTHEKPFLECNMVAVNYIMDILYYDIKCKNVTEYKLTTMDVEAIIKVCGILNISEDIQNIILTSMFRDDIYVDIENTSINSFCIIVIHNPELLKALAGSKLAKDKKIKGNLEFDVLRTITKNAIATKTEYSLKPIYDICTNQTIAYLVAEFTEIINPDIISVEACLFIINTGIRYKNAITLYNNLVGKLNSADIRYDTSSFGSMFGAISKYLQTNSVWNDFGPGYSKIMSVCTLLSKLK